MSVKRLRPAGRWRDRLPREPSRPYTVRPYPVNLVRVFASLVLTLAAGCAAAPDHTLHRELGGALQRVRNDVADIVGPQATGGFAGLDRRPVFVDLRNALVRLPHTLRFDVMPFTDNHAGVHLAESGGQDTRPHTMLGRMLAKIPW